MADAHEQPESSTAYSGTIRLNKRELEKKVDTFLDKDEEEYNSRKKAFLDIIREETHREGKNEQEIQFHIGVAESIMAIRRHSRVCYLRLELQEKRKKDRNEEDRIKNSRIKKNKIERKKIEKDKIENEKIEKDKIEEEKIKEREIKEEEIENDEIEKERIEKERIEKERIEKERIEKEKEKIRNDLRPTFLHMVVQAKCYGIPMERFRSKVIEHLIETNIGEEIAGWASDDIRAIWAQMEAGNGQTRDV